MRIGIVGLGRMGANIARRLMRGGHGCVVFDARHEAIRELSKDGAIGASSLEDLVRSLAPPRIAWLMLPAGGSTESVVSELGRLLDGADIVVDGGNGFYRDDIRRARALKEKNIRYVDIGTSGGIWGLERGYCLTAGGDEETVAYLDPILSSLAPGANNDKRAAGRSSERGYLHCGPVGAGHFVKMIHNGIEYGLMEAYAEGFDILRNALSERRPKEEQYNFKVAEIAEVWRHGSVIDSWLLDLIALALGEDGKLAKYSGQVEDSGEGRWTVMTAIETGVPADVLSAAVFARFRSRDEGRFANKLLSAMRAKFGGHV